MGNSCSGAASVSDPEVLKSSSFDTESTSSGRLSEYPRLSPNVELQWSKINEEKGRDEEEVYKIIDKIGVGSISTISMIKRKKSSSALKKERNLKNGSSLKVSSSRKRKVHYALKKVDLVPMSDEFLKELQNEINIMKNLDHPNVLRAFETYEKPKHMSIVLELCSGGDLKSRQPYSEDESAVISKKILSALAYLHDNNIIHRDLKCENIMFESNRKDAEVKIIDFGLSKKFDPESNEGMTEQVGTLYTMAPEVIEGNYTAKADVWSVGVMSYMLLSGTEPFPLRKGIETNILKGNYNFDDMKWKTISDQAKDFVSSLMEKNPNKRLSAKQGVEHGWLQRKSFSDKELSKSMMEQISRNVVQYSNVTDFKKLVLNIIAYKSTSDDVPNIRQAFDLLDEDQDGTIKRSHFEKLISQFVCVEEVDEIFSAVNVGKDGTIKYTEFLAASMEAEGEIDEGRLVEAFDRLDCDNTGFISKKNLCKILGDQCPVSKAESIIEEADRDGDGKISYTDFIKQFCHDKNENF